MRSSNNNFTQKNILKIVRKSRRPILISLSQNATELMKCE